jgi:hypothetical protein
MATSVPVISCGAVIVPRGALTAGAACAIAFPLAPEPKDVELLVTRDVHFVIRYDRDEISV